MKNVFIIAGESSGDLHGAELVEAAKQIDPEVRFSGIGGPRLAAAGAEIFVDLTEHAAVGFVEVFRGLGKFLSAYRLIQRKMREHRPDAIVLIDYPEFNLRVARKAKAMGVRVIYYVSPQIWAWRRGRVRHIEKYVDRMLTIFPFEADFYAQHGVEADFVGHPLVDKLKDVPGRDDARRRFGLDDARQVVTLLPGSRRKEIERLLPLMLGAAGLLRAGRPGLQFMIGAAPGFEGMIRSMTGDTGIKVVEGDTHAAMAASDLLLIASGTATAEAMILNVPMVMTYRLSTLTRLALGWMLKVDRYAMPNIIAGKMIIPELVQADATASNLYREANTLLEPANLATMRADLAEATAKLGGGGASARAAQKVIEIIQG